MNESIHALGAEVDRLRAALETARDQMDVLNRIHEEQLTRMEANNALLRKAIETVLRDDESAPGGWGPDVTCKKILRDALEAV